MTTSTAPHLPREQRAAAMRTPARSTRLLAGVCSALITLALIAANAGLASHYQVSPPPMAAATALLNTGIVCA